MFKYGIPINLVVSILTSLESILNLSKSSPRQDRSKTEKLHYITQISVEYEGTKPIDLRKSKNKPIFGHRMLSLMLQPITAVESITGGSKLPHAIWIGITSKFLLWNVGAQITPT